MDDRVNRAPASLRKGPGSPVSARRARPRRRQGGRTAGPEWQDCAPGAGILETGAGRGHRASDRPQQASVGSVPVGAWGSGRRARALYKQTGTVSRSGFGLRVGLRVRSRVWPGVGAGEDLELGVSKVSAIPSFIPKCLGRVCPLDLCVLGCRGGSVGW